MYITILEGKHSKAGSLKPYPCVWSTTAILKKKQNKYVSQKQTNVVNIFYSFFSILIFFVFYRWGIKKDLIYLMAFLFIKTKINISFE